MERNSGADVTIRVGDISLIEIVKKGGKGFLIGFITGAGLGGAFAMGLTSDVGAIALTALLGGVGTGILGAIISGLSSKNKTIQIEGKSDAEIQEILKNLHKNARIKNAQ